MKKVLFIIATAALFGACEQKTEVVTPAVPPAKETPDPAKAARLPRKTAPVAPTDATTTTETKTESTTTVTATPNP